MTKQTFVLHCFGHVEHASDDLVLLCSVRYKVAYNKETGACRLEISMTFSDDAGDYSIYIKNPHGEVSASALLMEEGKY